jgi:hypothetical protein
MVQVKMSFPIVRPNTNFLKVMQGGLHVDVVFAMTLLTAIAVLVSAKLSAGLILLYILASFWSIHFDIYAFSTIALVSLWGLSQNIIDHKTIYVLIVIASVMMLLRSTRRAKSLR